MSEQYFIFASRGRNQWWLYLATIAIGLAGGTFAATLVSILLALFRLMPADIALQISQPSDPSLFFGAIAGMFACVLFGIAGAAAIVQKKRPQDIIGCWRWSLFGWGVTAWLIVQCVLAAIDYAIVPSGFHRGGHLAPALVIWVLGAILIQTFTEEFIFRGFLTQGIFLLFRRPIPSACVSGLVFGAMHIPNGLPQAINAVWFGTVCAYLAIRTGGIALTCGIHLANNYFGAIGVVSAGDVFKGLPGLLIQNTPHLEWWDLSLAILAMTMAPWAFQRLGLLSDSAKS